MVNSADFLKNILGDTHQGRLIDKLGNFATENYGEKGLKFFNTLTAAQVCYQVYESRQEKSSAAKECLEKLTVDKINEFCKKEKNVEKQKAYAAEHLAIYVQALKHV